MLERLDHAFTSQRHFTANASHELRRPPTVMRTAIDVVLAKPEPQPTLTPGDSGKRRKPAVPNCLSRNLSP
jgi:signal transduction histidine kinase